METKHAKAIIIAAACAFGASIPTHIWETRRAEDGPINITCGIGNQWVTKFTTTNQYYISVEWTTNGVTPVGKLVTNKWRK